MYFGKCDRDAYLESLRKTNEEYIHTLRGISDRILITEEKIGEVDRKIDTISNKIR